MLYTLLVQWQVSLLFKNDHLSRSTNEVEKEISAISSPSCVYDLLFSLPRVAFLKPHFSRSLQADPTKPSKENIQEIRMSKVFRRLSQRSLHPVCGRWNLSGAIVWVHHCCFSSWRRFITKHHKNRNRAGRWVECSSKMCWLIAVGWWNYDSHLPRKSDSLIQQNFMGKLVNDIINLLVDKIPQYCWLAFD